jgi:hypothetical protein
MKARLAEELTQAHLERDQLLAALEKFQTQMNDLQAHAEIVTSDRNNIKQLYTQVVGIVFMLVITRSPDPTE